MRYVELKPAKQSSAGSITYVSRVSGTGLLRALTLYVSQAYRRSQRRARRGTGVDAERWI
ncbi:MAG: hypothetical protein LBM98_08530 [Oscillospiraceae bacterium]|nr:hypothetical protein [Oscillospiraceae bacterium]